MIFTYLSFIFRSQLKITLKVFLRDFNKENLDEAVNAALNHLQTDHVDSLFLAVPTDAIPVLGKQDSFWLNYNSWSFTNVRP